MDSGETTITKPVCYHIKGSGRKHQGFDRICFTIPCNENQTYRVLKPCECNEWLVNTLCQQGEVRTRVQQVRIDCHDY
jgi:hypothetical protein